MYIFRKLQVLTQALHNPGTLTLIPGSNVGRHRKGLVLEPKDHLPSYNRVCGGRRRVRSKLLSRTNSVGGLANNHAALCSNWGVLEEAFSCTRGRSAVHCLLRVLVAGGC